MKNLETRLNSIGNKCWPLEWQAKECGAGYTQTTCGSKVA